MTDSLKKKIHDIIHDIFKSVTKKNFSSDKIEIVDENSDKFSIDFHESFTFSYNDIDLTIKNLEIYGTIHQDSEIFEVSSFELKGETELNNNNPVTIIIEFPLHKGGVGSFSFDNTAEDFQVTNFMNNEHKTELSEYLKSHSSPENSESGLSLIDILGKIKLRTLTLQFKADLNQFYQGLSIYVEYKHTFHFHDFVLTDIKFISCHYPDGYFFVQIQGKFINKIYTREDKNNDDDDDNGNGNITKKDISLNQHFLGVSLTFKKDKIINSKNFTVSIQTSPETSVKDVISIFNKDIKIVGFLDGILNKTNLREFTIAFDFGNKRLDYIHFEGSTIEKFEIINNIFTIDLLRLEFLYNNCGSVIDINVEGSMTLNKIHKFSFIIGYYKDENKSSWELQAIYNLIDGKKLDTISLINGLNKGNSTELTKYLVNLTVEEVQLYVKSNPLRILFDTTINLSVDNGNNEGTSDIECTIVYAKNNGSHGFGLALSASMSDNFFKAVLTPDTSDFLNCLFNITKKTEINIFFVYNPKTGYKFSDSGKENLIKLDNVVSYIQGDVAFGLSLFTELDIINNLINDPNKPYFALSITLSKESNIFKASLQGELTSNSGNQFIKFCDSFQLRNISVKLAVEGKSFFGLFSVSGVIIKTKDFCTPELGGFIRGDLTPGKVSMSAGLRVVNWMKPFGIEFLYIKEASLAGRFSIIANALAPEYIYLSTDIIIIPYDNKKLFDDFKENQDKINNLKLIAFKGQLAIGLSEKYDCIMLSLFIKNLDLKNLVYDVSQGEYCIEFLSNFKINLLYLIYCIGNVITLLNEINEGFNDKYNQIEIPSDENTKEVDLTETKKPVKSNLVASQSKNSTSNFYSFIGSFQVFGLNAFCQIELSSNLKVIGAIEEINCGEIFRLSSTGNGNDKVKQYLEDFYKQNDSNLNFKIGPSILFSEHDKCLALNGSLSILGLYCGCNIIADDSTFAIDFILEIKDILKTNCKIFYDKKYGSFSFSFSINFNASFQTPELNINLFKIEPKTLGASINADIKIKYSNSLEISSSGIYIKGTILDETITLEFPAFTFNINKFSDLKDKIIRYISSKLYSVFSEFLKRATQLLCKFGFKLVETVSDAIVNVVGSICSWFGFVSIDIAPYLLPEYFGNYDKYIENCSYFIVNNNTTSNFLQEFVTTIVNNMDPLLENTNKHNFNEERYRLIADSIFDSEIKMLDDYFNYVKKFKKIDYDDILDDKNIENFKELVNCYIDLANHHDEIMEKYILQEYYSYHINIENNENLYKSFEYLPAYIHQNVINFTKNYYKNYSKNEYKYREIQRSVIKFMAKEFLPKILDIISLNLLIRNKIKDIFASFLNKVLNDKKNNISNQNAENIYPKVHKYFYHIDHDTLDINAQTNYIKHIITSLEYPEIGNNMSCVLINGKKYIVLDNRLHEISEDAVKYINWERNIVKIANSNYKKLNAPNIPIDLKTLRIIKGIKIEKIKIYTLEEKQYFVEFNENCLRQLPLREGSKKHFFFNLEVDDLIIFDHFKHFKIRSILGPQVIPNKGSLQGLLTYITNPQNKYITTLNKNVFRNESSTKWEFGTNPLNSKFSNILIQMLCPIKIIYKKHKKLSKKQQKIKKSRNYYYFSLDGINLLGFATYECFKKFHKHVIPNKTSAFNSPIHYLYPSEIESIFNIKNIIDIPIFKLSSNNDIFVELEFEKFENDFDFKDVTSSGIPNKIRYSQYYLCDRINYLMVLLDKKPVEVEIFEKKMYYENDKRMKILPFGIKVDEIPKSNIISTLNDDIYTFSSIDKNGLKIEDLYIKNDYKTSRFPSIFKEVLVQFNTFFYKKKFTKKNMLEDYKSIKEVTFHNYYKEDNDENNSEKSKKLKNICIEFSFIESFLNNEKLKIPFFEIFEKNYKLFAEIRIYQSKIELFAFTLSTDIKINEKYYILKFFFPKHSFSSISFIPYGKNHTDLPINFKEFNDILEIKTLLHELFSYFINDSTKDQSSFLNNLDNLFSISEELNSFHIWFSMSSSIFYKESIFRYHVSNGSNNNNDDTINLIEIRHKNSDNLKYKFKIISEVIKFEFFKFLGEKSKDNLNKLSELNDRPINLELFKNNAENKYVLEGEFTYQTMSPEENIFTKLFSMEVNYTDFSSFFNKFKNLDFSNLLNPYLTDPAELPKYFDYRNTVPMICRDVVNYIHDQGNKNICIAVAASSVFSDILCIFSRGQVNTIFEYHNLLDSSEDDTSGLTEEDLSKRFKANGLFSKYPYISSNKFGIQTKYHFYNDHFEGIYNIKPCDVNYNIKKHLMDIGPLLVTVDFESNKEEYYNNHYNERDIELSKHVVKLVGWCENPSDVIAKPINLKKNDQGYWICADSIGYNESTKGLIFIPITKSSDNNNRISKFKGIEATFLQF